MHLLAHVINEWLTILIFSLVDWFLRGERGGGGVAENWELHRGKRYLTYQNGHTMRWVWAYQNEMHMCIPK